MLGLSKMRELADGAQNVKLVSRKPVKTQFTEDEREIAKDFFRSQRSRNPNSMRMRSFFHLCKLLGEPLDASNWHLLEDADIVGDLHFLVGKGTVKFGNDWQLKVSWVGGSRVRSVCGGSESDLFRSRGCVLGGSPTPGQRYHVAEISDEFGWLCRSGHGTAA